MISTLLLAFALAAGSPQEHEPAQVPQAEIDRAIERGVRYLLAVQERDGGWYFRGERRAGSTALVLYALLKSGVDPSSEPVRRAVASLAQDDANETYDASILLLALETLDDPEYGEWIEQVAERLISFQERAGDWGYPGGGDLSNTQYAALGLRAAELAGIEVPAEVWTLLFEAVLDYGNSKGEFGYRRSGRGVRPAMTAAGIGTLAICAERLARRGGLTVKLRKHQERVNERGVAALARDFEDTIAADSGSWPFYKLYGVERLGAFLGLQRIGPHDWYQEGAARILAQQHGNGSWGFGRRGRGMGADPANPREILPSGHDEIRTAYALLFLRRASSFPKSGGGNNPAGLRTVFGTSSSSDPVQVRATGQSPLTLWITGWSRAVRDRWEWPEDSDRSPHVALVEYLVDGVVVASVAGDPTRPAGAENFAARHEFPKAGTYMVSARAHVVPPPAERRDDPGPTQTIVSPEFEVEIRQVAPAWQREQLDDRARNLLRDAVGRVKASSHLSEDGLQHPPELAVDNRQLTSWLAAPDDLQPELEVVLSRPRRADVVLLAGPRTIPHVAGFYARPLEVEVSINGGEPQRVLMHPDERQKARLELPRPVRIRKLELRIRWTVPGREHASTGLSEVELQLR